MSAGQQPPSDTTVQIPAPAPPPTAEALPPLNKEVEATIEQNLQPILKKQKWSITLSQIPTTIKLKLFEIFKTQVNTDQREEYVKLILQDLKNDAETKEKNAFREHNGPTEMNVIEKAAVMTTVAEGLLHLAEIISKSPILSGFVMVGMGAIIATPIGQGIIAASSLIAVGYFAIIAARAKFAKVFKVIRTLDEFSILLDKIRRMINLTVSISGTYKFDINVEEITAQIKIIFKRFDQILDDIDYKNIRKEVTNQQALSTIDVGGAAEHAIATSGVSINAEIRAQIQKENEPKEGGRRLVKRKNQIGGWWGEENFNSLKRSFKRLRFPVEEWNRNLIDDIVRLNIRLTTAMGEFNIVLNVLQMSMIANTINPKSSAEIRNAAIESFIDRNNEVKSSSDYQNLLIGILLNDILAIKVDFDYCRQGGWIAGKTTTDSICIEYTQTDKTGNFVTTYRPKLHKAILKLCDQLKNGEGYDHKLKATISEQVIKPYIDLLQKAKFSAEPSDIEATLKSLNIEGAVAYENKNSIDKGLDKCVNEITTGLKGITEPVVQPPVVQPPVVQPPGVQPPVVQQSGGQQTGGQQSVVQHGGVWNPFKSNKHTAATDTLIINYLIDVPTNLISNDNLAAYFQQVYEFVKNISNQSKKDNAKTMEQMKKSIPKELSPANAAPGVEVGSPADINQPPAVGVAAPATAPATTTAAVQAPAGEAEKKSFFSGLFGSSSSKDSSNDGSKGGRRATRKKARRTKSAPHLKPKSYKYRVKL